VQALRVAAHQTAGGLVSLAAELVGRSTMTLVVARLIDGAVRIVSDWQVTYPDNRPSGPLRGTIKAFPLSKGVALAFAGSVQPAFDAICQLPPGIAPLEVADRLAPVTLGGATEFLTASESAIHVVREGHVAMNQTVAWLGDHDAFDSYQRHYHRQLWFTLPPSPVMSGEGNDAVVRMSIGFSAVLADDRFPSVKGFPVTLSAGFSSVSGFHYLPVTAAFGLNAVPTGVSGEFSLMNPQSAEQGGYAYSVLVPVDSGVAAIGAHFLQGEFGALFRPGHLAPTATIKAASTQEFIDIVERNHGIRLSGILWGPSASPS
jgi:hypothetical protein